jgi:hypothetical protein
MDEGRKRVLLIAAIIPNPGDETIIWLQFGSNVKWNEQLR